MNHPLPLSEVRKFDIRAEAEWLFKSTWVDRHKIQPLVFGLMPLGVGLAGARTASALHLELSAQLLVFLIAGLVTEVPCYILYRAQMSLGPVALEIRGRTLIQSLANGKTIQWDLEKRRSLGVVTVTALDGGPLVWNASEYKTWVSVPCVSWWPQRRFAVSTDAAWAVIRLLRSMGWTESIQVDNRSNCRCELRQISSTKR